MSVSFFNSGALYSGVVSSLTIGDPLCTKVEQMNPAQCVYPQAAVSSAGPWYYIVNDQGQSISISVGVGGYYGFVPAFPDKYCRFAVTSAVATSGCAVVITNA